MCVSVCVCWIRVEMGGRRKGVKMTNLFEASFSCGGCDLQKGGGTLRNWALAKFRGHGDMKKTPQQSYTQPNTP